MDSITIERNPSPAKLDAMGVEYWPIWEKEVSTFEWTYDTNEKCYLLEGEVTVTPKSGEPVEIKAYDLVSFPKGMSCTWEIRSPVKKHYVIDS
ncbi:MAG: cupin domain-containing protein [Gammaproteobacteria bacterium]|nr:cupin domain-containing protein [Gammaproteobacteria bacterium]MCK5092871.1 cupin domain-containing protein [Gammaproteobacteria bacterium]